MLVIPGLCHLTVTIHLTVKYKLGVDCVSQAASPPQGLLTTTIPPIPPKTEPPCLPTAQEASRVPTYMAYDASGPSGHVASVPSVILKVSLIVCLIKSSPVSQRPLGNWF